MITWLARRRWGRIALIPAVLGAGAWSWGGYLDGTANVQDAGRVRSWWGWLDVRLDPEWARFDGAESRYHLLKNMGSEWSRLDVQRSYKAMSFLVVLFVVSVAAIVLAVLGGGWL